MPVGESKTVRLSDLKNRHIYFKSPKVKHSVVFLYNETL